MEKKTENTWKWKKQITAVGFWWWRLLVLKEAFVFQVRDDFLSHSYRGRTLSFFLLQLYLLRFKKPYKRNRETYSHTRAGVVCDILEEESCIYMAHTSQFKGDSYGSSIPVKPEQKGMKKRKKLSLNDMEATCYVLFIWKLMLSHL